MQLMQPLNIPIPVQPVQPLLPLANWGSLVQDFLEMLPIPEITHPKGPLNMHGFFPDMEIKPDLGPKSYIALGK